MCQQGVCASTAWDATVVVGSNGAGAVALSEPSGTAVDRRGDVFIADTNHHRIVERDVSGAITIIAGTGASGASAVTAARRPRRRWPRQQDVAVDGLGNVYISDQGNQRIRRVDTAGIITTIAGTGPAGSFGDGGPAILADLHNPTAVAVDGRGDVFIADTGNDRVREIDASGTITTVAGQDGSLAAPNGVAVDGDDLVIADANHNQIDRLVSGTLTVIANASGAPGSSGDGGPALDATLSDPFGIAVAANGDIFVADRSNNRVRRISRTARSRPSSAPGCPRTAATAATRRRRRSSIPTTSPSMRPGGTSTSPTARTSACARSAPPGPSPRRSAPAFRWRRAMAARRRARSCPTPTAWASMARARCSSRTPARSACAAWTRSA